jgi:hypothetical protein
MRTEAGKQLSSGNLCKEPVFFAGMKPEESPVANAKAHKTT